jgi:prevent-host-death family protein
VSDRVIPQRELRNNVGAVLRAAEAGETFTITVRGRAVARLGPVRSGDEPRLDVDRTMIRRILAEPNDAGLADELEAVEEPVGDPWPV